MCRAASHTSHLTFLRALAEGAVYCRVVQDKAYETGIPQKLGEHANTARDAAAQKYSDLTTEVTALTGSMLEMLADLSPLRTFMHYLEAGLG